MTTTSLLSSSSSVTATSASTLNKDGTINEDNRNMLLGSTVTTTATVLGASYLNAKTIDEIYQKYADAYVESMSDEDLELALVNLDLLEENISENSIAKTI